jgi:hypothetical protein
MRGRNRSGRLEAHLIAELFQAAYQPLLYRLSVPQVEVVHASIST